MRDLCTECRDGLFEILDRSDRVLPERPVYVYRDGKFQHMAEEIEVISRREVFAVNIKTGGE